MVAAVGEPPFSPSTATQLTMAAQLHHNQPAQSHNLLPGGRAGHPTQLNHTGRCPLQPLGGPNEPPRTPSLQLFSLNVNGLRGRQKRAALFAALQAGPWHVVALQETHHASQAEATQCS